MTVTKLQLSASPHIRSAAPSARVSDEFLEDAFPLDVIADPASLQAIEVRPACAFLDGPSGPHNELPGPERDVP